MEPFVSFLPLLWKGSENFVAYANVKATETHTMERLFRKALIVVFSARVLLIG